MFSPLHAPTLLLIEHPFYLMMTRLPHFQRWTVEHSFPNWGLDGISLEMWYNFWGWGWVVWRPSSGWTRICHWGLNSEGSSDGITVQERKPYYLQHTIVSLCWAYQLRWFAKAIIEFIHLSLTWVMLMNWYMVNIFWHILQHSYQFPVKLLTIILAQHENSTATVRHYRKKV